MCQTCVNKRQTLLHLRSFALFPDLILLHAFQPFVHYDERQVWSRDGVAVGTAAQVDMGFFVCNLQPSPPDHVLWREYDNSCRRPRLLMRPKPVARAHAQEKHAKSCFTSMDVGSFSVAGSER